MRKACLILAALFLLLSPVLASAAEQVKLRYVRTLYTDAEGGKLSSPEGVTATEGRIYIADSGNQRVLSYSVKDGMVTADAAFSMAKSYPLMVRVDAKGTLYVLDEKDRSIKRLSASGASQGIFAPKGVPGGQKIVPRSFTFTEDGNMILLDLFSGRVLVLDGQGNYLSAIPFPEEHGFFSDVAVDKRGSIYLLDSVQAVVYRAAKGAESFSPLTESLKDYMNFPTSLAPDNQGRIFLVDQYGSGLAVIGSDGTFLGRKLSMGWSEGTLYYPSRISFGPDGHLFIADRGNNRVQEFSVE